MLFLLPPPFDPNSLKPISHTFVQYSVQDPSPFGIAFAYASLIPIFLIVSYVSIFCARREIIVLNALIGQLLCEAVNLVLKKAIRESRPTEMLGNGYGMPSSHAQFMGYFSLYVVLYIYKKIHIASKWRHLLAIVTVSVSVAVNYSRVYLHYHTPAQVLAGYSIGGLLGLAWYYITEQHLRSQFWKPLVLESPLFKLFCVRDSLHIENVWEKEWEMAYRALEVPSTGKAETSKRK